MNVVAGGEQASKKRRWGRWLVIGVLGGVAALVGGPYVYIHFIEGKAPAPLTITTSSPTSEATSTADFGSVDGTWTVASGSQAGYRVKEILFGQNNEAVGRTGTVTGSLTVNGTTVSTASVTVDLASVRSDQSRRDNQFRGRIMNVASFPTATFVLSKPIELGSIPVEGVQSSAAATGELTLHGTTKTVQVTITGKRTGGTIQISGSIPVVFAEWGIPNPSFGPVSTEDHGSIEFLINFARA